MLNFNTKSKEYKGIVNYPDPGSWCTSIYSEIYDLFIGKCSKYVSSGKYDRTVSVIENPKQTFVLYPNPTNNSVTVKNICSLPILAYSITSLNGQNLINSSAPNINNSIQIDFSHFPSGIYFLNLNCESNILTYKIIKEN